MPAFVDLSGRTFGGLRALKRAPDGLVSGKSTVRWVCLCRCGKRLEVSSASLRAENGTRHCKPCADRIGGTKRIGLRRINMIGRVTGRLTVLRLGAGAGKELSWLCRCDCGKEVDLRSAYLRGKRAYKNCSRLCSLRPVSPRRERRRLKRPRTWWHQQAMDKRDALPRPSPVRGAKWLSVSASGAFALVDPDVYERVKNMTWHLDRYGYPWARNGGKMTRLHHVALGAGDGVHVDHKNRKTLDCRRKNLRMADKSKNGANKAKTRGGSRFKGVCWNKRDSRWRAYITVRGVRYELGHVVDEEEAARRYDTAAREHFGEFACLNFPKRGERSALT